jgi:type II secretory pathway pseudopilin PulG
MFRRPAFLLLILACGLSPAFSHAQSDPDSTPQPTTAAPKPSQASPKAGSGITSKPASVPANATQTSPGDPDSEQPSTGSPPQIVVTSPTAQPSTWTWHDKVLWGALIVLVILGYIGVILALRILKNIQRQTEFGVSAAQAALQCANAALESSQAIVDSGRPWIVITIEPFLTVEHGFKVMATNRGRTPARILAKADCVKIASDETKLPATPDYDSGKSATPFEPIILLPGESAGIRPFRRADVRSYCASDDQFKRVEKWEEKLFIFGRVIYRDLISPLDQPNHETDWCCWYVYGDKDALVIAGPPEYNKHN